MLDRIETTSPLRAIGKRRSEFRPDEGSFVDTKLSRIYRALYPVKTAEHVAASTGCSVRQAQFRLAGVHGATAADLRAIINEILES